ncbi:YitT family protein [Levilactobacillus bambusae]|uniref:DUF2179 domain-containing protein n=1 Tax=Levilactobacillus bambusae TaxID=2024736 RepID=A0A2V1N105_9LACO|nr:YitT family protein [Levilactobacillus bambusae]PWG00762.1 hypothetical protein DCM90_00875 [Levilactobacillus bambusae]
METIRQMRRRNDYLSKVSAALLYAVCVSIAVNFFWTPGHIYSSGITGLAQLVDTISNRVGPVHIPVAAGLFIFNVPMFIIGWRRIGHTFTVFTFISVLFASIGIRLLHPVSVIHDPLICAIFGSALNGFGTGFALRSGISTGGLDILGIVIQRKTGHSIGRINLTFNIFIIIAAGFAYGWPYALYSALGLVVNSRVMNLTYTRQQRLQVMIITSRPKTVIDSVQNHLRRGITIIHDAEGAYKHDSKTILITAISRYEMGALEEAMDEADPHAFVSMTPITKILGHFYEPKL